MRLTEERLIGIEGGLTFIGPNLGPLYEDLKLAITELIERRAADDSFRVQVARAADALPVDHEADARAARALNAALAKQGPPRKLIPALSAEDREALGWLRRWATPRLDVSTDPHASCEHCVVSMRALAVLDRLLGGERGK